jgi:predicted lactoylglutathione lyase
MTKHIWLNLPVNNVEKSKKFFINIGFSFNEEYCNEQSACMLVGEKNFVVMLFERSMFATFVQNAIVDTQSHAEMLISIDAESRNEVEELAQKAEEAGGVLFAKPAENQGWMYGCGFSDLDGHRWNILFMDYDKLKN